MAKRSTQTLAKTKPAPVLHDPKPAPVRGERTGRQSQGYSTGGFMGQGCNVGRPDYETYRKMRRNPTIAMARAAACAPLKMAEYSVEADDGIPDDAVTLVSEMLDRLWPTILKASLSALDYGWSPSELVWGIRDGATTLERIKPLYVDITQPLVTTSTGRLVGVRQQGVDLIGPKAYVFTNDSEADNPFGRARNENCREFAWAPWTATAKRMADYFGKVAGVIPIMRYPAGQQQDGATGQLVNNEVTAATTLGNLGRGAGVAIPWDFPAWAEAALNRGIDPTALVAWQIEFLETKGDHSGGFISAMRYYDSLMCRGWLVPERAITEGQSGTKAEAESHGDIAIAVAGELLKDICAEVNRQIIRPLVETNFGPVVADGVRMVPAPLVNADKAFIRNLVAAILTAPGNADLLFSVTDFDAMLDQSGVPKSAQVVDAAAVKSDPTADPQNPDAATLPPTRTATVAASRGALLAVLDDIYRKGHHGR
jgi:hypothetical protein